jgi:transcriptional regulator with XRE-family HTH domain
MGRANSGKTFDEEKFIKILKEYRIKSGYSQRKFADILNLCQSSYNKFENGKMTLSVKRMIEIAELLGIKNQIEDPINFSGFKGIIKFLSISVFEDFAETAEAFQIMEKEAKQHLYFDSSVFPEGRIYAVLNKNDLEIIEEGEYVIVNLNDKEIKEDDVAVIKKNNKIMVKKLIKNRFAGNKKYPDLNLKDVEILGRVIMAVRMRTI